VGREFYEVGRLNSGESTDYAAGLNVSEARGFRWITHGGSWVGYRSSIVRVPAEHFSTIVLCNRAEADAGDYARRIAETFLVAKLGPAEPEDQEEEPAAPAAAWSPEDPSRYAGVYISEEADARCVIDQRGQRLVLETCADGEILKPGKPGEFVTEGGWPTLRFSDDGRSAGSFVYWSPGLRGLTFKRVEESSE
jgi:hypothetical protein